MSSNKNIDRLFNLLPSIYRQKDAEKGWPLRSLLQIIAEQVDAVEGDISQLYENWFIETCQDWVVPYIGDLISYRLVNEVVGEPEDTSENRALKFSRILIPRREVANTVAFRRRKGTLALLELLSNYVAGWPARAVEFYKLLCWTQAINHLRLKQGRTADLRQGDELERLGGPFDSLAHTVDIHRINSQHSQGRYNINSVGLFVWRLKSYPVTKTTAYCREDIGHHCYTFSVLGNDTQLYTLPEPEETPTHIANELNVPAPIRPRAFSIQPKRGEKKLPEASSAYYGANKSLLIWARDWAGNSGSKPVSREAIIPANLRNWQYCPPRDHVAVDPVLGRIAFPPNQLPKKVKVSYHYAFSDDIGGGEYPRRLQQNNESKIYLVGAKKTEAEEKKFSSIKEALHQWHNDKPSDAIIEIAESSVYAGRIKIRLGENQNLQIRAANKKRPIIRLLDWKTGSPDDLNVEGKQGSSLVIDGLLIAGRGIQTRGNIDSLLVRHSTLVPGWIPRYSLSAQRHTAKASIELFGSCKNLNLEHSIIGSIQVTHDEVHEDPIKINIRDSIVDSMGPDHEAIGAPGYRLAHASLTILRSTIFGQIQAHAIELAENSIFNGIIRVARRQTGCMRFCYVPHGSRTPRRYNCQPDSAEKMVREKFSKNLVELELENARHRVKPQFNSTIYGTPTYCQLSKSCADEIVRGADDRSEMGVFHDLYQPQRAIALRARLDEYSQAYMDNNIIYIN